MPADRPAHPVLLHVGYHKTATTWLQNQVFKPRHGFRQILTHKEIFDGVIAPHGLDFDPAPLAAEIATRRAADPAGTQVDVISLEALSGLPYEGGRESDVYARRLQALVPDARILITIREQYAILTSIYMQYLLRGGTESIKAFFDEMPFDGYAKFTAQNFRYHRLVGLYQELFGAQNVLALPQEEIAADQGRALHRLAGFAGNSALVETIDRDGWTAAPERGLSYPQFAVPALRRVNYFRRDALNPNPILDLSGSRKQIYRSVGWMARSLPWPERLRRSRPVTEHVRQRFAGFFAESNRALAAQLVHQVDLSRYDGIAAAAEPRETPVPRRSVG